MKYKSKIIVALDFQYIKEAKKIIKTLYPRVKFFKIGSELINTGKAPELIKFINSLGARVFYDIKLNDIPNTVGRASKVISDLGAWGFTVHASAGQEAIRAAVANKGSAKVIGVTVLTSLKSSKRKVIDLAEMLVREGIDGIVCSVEEAKFIKPFDKIVITPGIRPSWFEDGDQKRVSTPASAIKAGVHYLVIGRPITNPPESILPQKALDLIIKEINESR